MRPDARRTRTGCRIPAGCRYSTLLFCTKAEISAAEYLLCMEQFHQHLPAECLAVQSAQFRKCRTVYPVDPAVLHQFRFLGICIEIRQRHALFYRNGICRKSKCTRQQFLFCRTAGSCPQHGTVPQMHTVKEAQCHSTFLCQRCSDALESFQARFRLSISYSFPHAVRPHSGLPVQFRRSCRLHRKHGTNPAPAERPPHGSVPA